jgi:maltose/maltodextrin transport system substrate-binding protein
LLWDYNNTYFTYPWLNATGGYAFKQTSTGWDKTDVGVDHPKMIEQAELLKQLIDDGVIEQGVDYGVMDQRFKQGDVAMILNGPWSWADYEQVGINFEVRGYRINGHDPRPFAGVLAATVNANSTNQAAAIAFIENYLTTKAGMSTVNDERSVGVPANLSLLADFADNESVMALATVMFNSEPIPNIPEMGAFWSNMGPALTAITQGRQTAAEALADAAQRIR